MASCEMQSGSTGGKCSAESLTGWAVDTMRCRVVARASVIVRRVVVVEPLVRTRLALRRRAIHEGVPVVLRRAACIAVNTL